MPYCDKCGGPLKCISEAQTVNGETVVIYECTNCGHIKEV